MGSKHSNRLGSIFEEVKSFDDNKKMVHSVLIKCTMAGCETTAKKLDRRGIHPNVHLKHFTKLGWMVWADMREASCPDCQKRSPARNKNTPQSLPQDEPMGAQNGPLSGFLGSSFMPELPGEQQEASLPKQAKETNVVKLEQPAVQPPVVPMTATAPKAAPAKMSERTAIAELYLDEHFVVTGDGFGYFTKGKSDADGAMISSLSLEKFREVREEGYGRLADFRQMSGELDGLKSRITSAIEGIDGKLSGLQKHAEAPMGLSKDDELKIAKLHEQRAALVTQHDQRIERVLEKFKKDMVECKTKFEADLDKSFEVLDAQVKEISEKAMTYRQKVVQPAVSDLLSIREDLRTLKGSVEDMRGRVPRVA